ncbi:hypothetical protein FIV42_16010 [Persicimonas caeni]|uniref:Uncharacterized protein n=1 Tax=Persicimonas caeni TaxID=2292766 RepID=A0A4Y6PVB7_PERCE|nr:hypothetical protein [Persicimonas caeni]QDG52190.1 hypothetical protein FIV42_16010 [Persicimonas caeni]QED33412.1 hypothetical protein FRD00_16005 [Persicimonas caeni]
MSSPLDSSTQHHRPASRGQSTRLGNRPCPDCHGQGATPEVVVDYIDGVYERIELGNILWICQTCRGDGEVPQDR